VSHDGFYKSSGKDKNNISTKTFPSNISKETTSSYKVFKDKPSTSTPKSPTKLSSTKCFKCLGFGHIVANYPNKRTPKLKEEHHAQIKTKTKSENERENEGQDNTGIITSPQRCFSSLSFKLPKHSKYLTYLIKKFRDDIQKPPKGYHLLKGFSQNHFIPKYSFRTWPVARIQPYNLPKLNEHKFASHLPYTNHVNQLTMLFAGVLNSRTNSCEPGEHDTNRQMTKDTTSTSQKGQSSQDTKSGPTKPRERINKRRRSYKPEYHKFFVLVFLKK